MASGSRVLIYMGAAANWYVRVGGELVAGFKKKEHAEAFAELLTNEEKDRNNAKDAR